MHTSRVQPHTLDLRQQHDGIARGTGRNSLSAEHVSEEAYPRVVLAYPPVQVPPQLTGSYLRILIMLLIAGSAWHLLPVFASSLAYFSDTEASPGTLASGLIELMVTDPATTVIGCGDMADLEVPVDTSTNGFGAALSASTTMVTGDAAFCSALDLSVQYKDADGVDAVYNGPLSGFTAPSMSTGTVRFIASLPSGIALADSATCTMDVTFDAWIASAPSKVESGFSDTKTTHVTFAVEPGSCTDCPPPPCSGCAGGDVEIEVTNHNTATVTNNVVVTASTGGNSADGGEGGDGEEEEQGDGGVIQTGDATARTVVTNVVNSNTTVIDLSGGCACSECPCGAASQVSVSNTSGSTGTSSAPSVQDILARVQSQLGQVRDSSRRR